MTDEEKLYQEYYQPDWLWSGGKAIKELHKNFYVEKKHQVMASKTSFLAGSYTTSTENRSSSL